MISTRIFSRQTSLWSSLTPTLEPVVRSMNAGQQTYASAVPAMGGEPANNSLIAEAAFVAAAQNLDVDQVGQGIVEQVRQYLNAFPKNPPSEVELDGDELSEISGLAQSLRTFVECTLTDPEFLPFVPGCGVIDSAHADIRDGETLIEVKSVSRPFRGLDIRQILTYCAMYYADNQRIEDVIILNPRRGVYSVTSLDFICRGASGLEVGELLFDIAQLMAELQVSG